MNNPIIRFKKVDGSDFSDWKESSFQEIFEFRSSISLSRSQLNYTTGEIKNIHYGDILLKFPSIVHTDNKLIPYINQDCIPNKYDLLEKGDVVFADTAEDYSLGKAIEIGSTPFRITSGLHTIACKAKLKFASGFLVYYLNSNFYHCQINKLATGTKVYSIIKSNIIKTKLRTPSSLEEQQKIASFFSTLDQKIELNERKLEALEKLKKGIGRRLLIKDPESQLENSHWKIVRISEVADLITGFPFNSSDFSKSGIRLIKGANIKRGTLSFDQKTSSFWPSDAGLAKYALETGDLLVQMDGALVGESFGRVTEDLLPALLVQRVTRIRATEDIIEIIYQIFCIGNFLKFVQSVKTNTAIPHISLQNIKDFEISIPEDVNELHKLANFFRLLDAKINLVKRKKELYTYLKSGFLQQMFI